MNLNPNFIIRFLDLVLIYLQIAASLLCAAASGMMFVKWRMLLPENRLRVWNLYGWFTSLICGGSVALIISVAAWTGFLVNFYPADYRSPNRQPVAPGPESTAADFSMARVSVRVVGPGWTWQLIFFLVCADTRCRRCAGLLRLP
jgi:hypothetical protein